MNCCQEIPIKLHWLDMAPRMATIWNWVHWEDAWIWSESVACNGRVAGLCASSLLHHSLGSLCTSGTLPFTNRSSGAKQNNKQVTRRKAFPFLMGAFIHKLSMQFWSEYGLCILLCTHCNVVTGFAFDQPCPCQTHCSETLRTIHFTCFFFFSEFEQAELRE